MRLRSVLRSRPILPAAIDLWPALAFEGQAVAHSAEAVHEALARIRDEHLFWPVPRDDAATVPSVQVKLGSGRWRLSTGASLSTVRPEGLTRIADASSQSSPPFALLAGVTGSEKDACDLLARSIWHCPWTRRILPLSEGVEALAFLHARGAENSRPTTTIGLSGWKRRVVTPFLTGPHGPPRHHAAHVQPEAAASTHWGPYGPPGSVRMEDGFLRSVGLGVRHTPPASLIIDAAPLHFDARSANGFDHLVDATNFDEALLERAHHLRARIHRAGLSKYSLPGKAAAFPQSDGREAILVPGQVQGDASLTLGVRGPSDNLTLLRRTREAFPDACIVYKPHPDVVTGLRPGHITRRAAMGLADAIASADTIGPCLDWCDRVVTFTSLAGFEALLRGKQVTTFGRPFYAGRGLTDDRDPPSGRRQLSLDALTAAALILYPRYIDPCTGLPAPVEHVVDVLAAERRGAHRLPNRLRNAVRHLVSELRHGCPNLLHGART